MCCFSRHHNQVFFRVFRAYSKNFKKLDMMFFELLF
nr:MAG TPA: METHENYLTETRAHYDROMETHANOPTERIN CYCLOHYDROLASE [Caudoviricetes sp.]